jgi:predicted DNA-binding transcriptional regulator AlpA
MSWLATAQCVLAGVRAYLKLGRKAVWERKRDPKLGFPQPVTLGSSRPRWRGQDVRAWAGAQ